MVPVWRARTSYPAGHQPTRSARGASTRNSSWRPSRSRWRKLGAGVLFRLGRGAGARGARDATGRPRGEQGLRVFVSAGEVSGDIVGALLVRKLRRIEPRAKIFGVGGAHMAAAGVEIDAHTNHLGTVGVTEAVRAIPAFARVLSRSGGGSASRAPDVAVLIGNDVFNVLLARWLRRRGIVTVSYFPPQVWIWRADGPVHREELRRNPDELPPRAGSVRASGRGDGDRGLVRRPLPVRHARTPDDAEMAASRREARPGGCIARPRGPAREPPARDAPARRAASGCGARAGPVGPRAPVCRAGGRGRVPPG